MDRMLERVLRHRALQHGAVAAVAVAVGFPAWGQDASSVQAWSVTPRVTLTTIATDNALLGRGGKQDDQTLEVAPGIRVLAQGARLKGSFDLSVRELVRARNSSGNGTQTALNTSATLEAVENWFFVDFTGVIAQQSISALGTQAASTTAINANQTETSTYRLSPYLKGKLLGRTDYLVRYSVADTRSKSALAVGTHTEDWQARVSSPRAVGVLGWSLDATGQNAAFANGRDNESRRLRASVNYPINETWNVSVLGGQERNNFLLTGRSTQATAGFGVDWTPGPRTKISLERERRFFGTGHRFSAEHRTPRTVWRFNSSRDVSATPGQSAQAGNGTVYDLYFAQFASLEPDLTARALLVQSFLQANGLAADTVVNAGFLTSGLSVSRRTDLSIGLIGARNTLTFLFSSGETSRGSLIAPVTGVPADDLTAGAVRQHGLNVSFSHKLSGLSSLSAIASQQRSSGGAGIETRLRSLSLGVSRKLGLLTNASVMARHSEFDSTINPYTENAVTGMLAIQF